jgi:trans-aconitate methyltransferase
MLAAARQRNLHVEQHNATALTYHEQFDAVFSNAALHWISSLSGHHAVLKGVYRSLRPGGRFVAEMGGHGNIAAIQVALAAVIARHSATRDLAGGFTAEQMNYFPTPAAYRARLERGGFSVEEIQLIPRPTPLSDSGMEGWLMTFRRGVLDALPELIRHVVVAETVALLEPVLRDEQGNWTADYVRLRFVARAE